MAGIHSLREDSRLQTGHKHGKGQDDCCLCKGLGEITPASSWCSDCEESLCSRCAKMHLTGSATKKHDLFDLSGGAKVKQRRKTKCKEHEGEQIKFICKDCNTTACQTCCIIKHRACKHVVTIGSVMPEIKSALREKRHSLQEKMRENVASLKKEESSIEQLKNMERKTTSEIKSTIESTVLLLRKKENDLLKELNDETCKFIAQHQANVRSGQIITQMYQQHCEGIDQALQSESEMDMYDMNRVCQSGAVECVETDTIYRPVVGEVTFTLNMEPVRKVISEMGRIHSTESSVSRKGPYTLSAPVLLDTIDIKHSKDAGPPKPIDVTVLTVYGVQTVVVADWNNNSLKSVYDKNGKKVISTLELSPSPYGVAKMKRNKVAVTVDDSHILVAQVRPELVLISKVKTCKQYYGITSLPDSTLAVGSDSPPVVHIIDLSGNVLRYFTPHKTGLNLIQSPRFLCTTHEGSILVFDLNSKSVYCLASEGVVVSTYTPTGARALRDPGGITVTDTGDILLAERESKKIIQLSSDGIFVRNILTSGNGIDEPFGLFVDDTNKLYVCDTRRVKVFKIA